MFIHAKIGHLLFGVVINFLLIVSYFIAQAFVALPNGFFLVLVFFGLTFCILGSVLLYRSREYAAGVKTFLLVTGFSAIMPFVGAVLHNLFYGLAQVFQAGEVIFSFLEGLFFIVALLIAPITFVFGVVGSVLLLRNQKNHQFNNVK